MTNSEASADGPTEETPRDAAEEENAPSSSTPGKVDVRAEGGAEEATGAGDRGGGTER
jgi:hypothetical protein